MQLFAQTQLEERGAYVCNKVTAAPRTLREVHVAVSSSWFGGRWRSSLATPATQRSSALPSWLPLSLESEAFPRRWKFLRLLGF